ncbi:right-handed parallel beta-helix repeat-containing protein [Cellulomonas rhizosphaerae]|uniref:Right-handed parallel beta-helix repeat-containing protein n=1 Tax=Cellulomonas rhizosphaerae TaxID=2293719 RepID=A0A413RNT4_9CELL|nr:right-handed parallel beta-helix repeat-containing protein [Cellulomonas rhizosphaerae]
MLGTVDYDIPTTNVLYVSTSGSDSNPGTVGSPKRTVAAASEALKGTSTSANPGTVVIRGGTYHEGAYQPGNGYYLRWQAYPGEIVWFDGSTVASSWTDNGNGTWTTAYTAPAIPGIGTDKIGDDPNALLPDMCFYDGTELYQVADGATPAAGQFSVNRGSNTLTIATSPSGHEVRYSDLVYLLTSGSRIDLLGLGIRRYRCAGNTLHVGMYYGGTSADTVIENVHVTQMGRNALYVGKDRTRITATTFYKIGQTAVLGGDLDDLVIEQCKIHQTDTGKWKTQPTSGAIKLTVARRSTLRFNHMRYSHNGNMIWYDVSCSQVLCYGNDIDGTSLDGTTYADSGICYEECDGGFWDGVQYQSLIAANTVVNCHKSIVICASGNVDVANNTIGASWAGSAQAILVLQDRDINHGGQEPAINVPWWCAGVAILNNRVLAQSNGWQLLAYDSQGEVPRPRAVAAHLGSASGQQIGGAMLSKVAGNWFAPATGSSSSGSVMATIGKADGGRTNANTPAALAAPNAAYGLSSSNIGTNYQSAAEPTSAADHATSEPITARIAVLFDAAAGMHYVGNPLPAPVPV